MLLLAVSSCGYDNFENPKATFTSEKLFIRHFGAVRLEARVPGYNFCFGMVYALQFIQCMCPDGILPCPYFSVVITKLGAYWRAPWERPSDKCWSVYQRESTVRDIPLWHLAPYFFIKTCRLCQAVIRLPARFTINKVVCQWHAPILENMSIIWEEFLIILADARKWKSKVRDRYTVSSSQENIWAIRVVYSKRIMSLTPINRVNQTKSSEYCYQSSLIKTRAEIRKLQYQESMHTESI